MLLGKKSVRKPEQTWENHDSGAPELWRDLSRKKEADKMRIMQNTRKTQWLGNEQNRKLGDANFTRE